MTALAGVTRAAAPSRSRLGLGIKLSRDREGVPHGPAGPPMRMKVSGTHLSELSRDRKGADVPGTAAIRSLTVAARSLAWVTFNGAVARGASAPLLLLLTTLPLLPASKPTVQTLMAADEEFCRDFTARGVEGWLAHFADDAVVFAPGGPITRDRKSLEQHYRRLFGTGNVPLTWKPLGGEIAASGDRGFTYGTWQMGGDKPRTGKYQTTWKKQRDGSWKIVADIGNPDDPGRRTQ